MQKTNTITVTATVLAPVEKVWNYWVSPEHILKWNNASNDWHTPAAANDLRPGGAFCYRMAAKDGSAAFDFEGAYHRVDAHRQIDYTIADGRHVSVRFEAQGNATRITETFEPENIHSHELQQAGWQAILNNFKKHTEEN
jgi:uncharacterized protein YndB with AHSA1/START domain